ncbi:MAG: serine/threonine protein kinase [Sandaracinaceae bacterium]|nr:serine/threonine protein kinase [Sandaracinaceae bacterium]
MTEHGDAVPAWIGPFRVTRRLGSGGMAEVFEAERRVGGEAGPVQRVCVKRILPALAPEPELHALFAREGRLVAALSHRAIARLVDFGVDRGAPYLALELVEGLDLRALLRRQRDRRLPPEVVALLAVELAEALAHAHARRILHRDVSPANVLVSREGEVKLTDFGVGKALDAGLARSLVVRGNLGYLAPERLDPRAPTSASADLFSLGAVLFECLTGARPHRTPAIEAGAEPATLRGLEAPAPLVAIVERLVALDPRRRPRSAREVVDTLAPIAKEALARRALAARVREAERGAPPTPPQVPARWRRYALGPKAWRDVARAQAMRSSHTGQPPPEERTAPDPVAHDEATLALPAAWRVSPWTVGLAAASLLAALGLTWWLASS